MAQAQEQFAEIVNKVSSQNERVTVTVRGHATAVLISHDELERLEETIAVLGDGELMLQIAAAEADVAAGRLQCAEDLARSLRRRGPRA